MCAIPQSLDQKIFTSNMYFWIQNVLGEAKKRTEMKRKARQKGKKKRNRTEKGKIRKEKGKERKRKTRKTLLTREKLEHKEK